MIITSIGFSRNYLAAKRNLRKMCKKKRNGEDIFFARLSPNSLTLRQKKKLFKGRKLTEKIFPKQI